MTISERDWNNYVQRLSQLDRRAGEAMGQYIKRYGTEDTEGLIVYANALVTKYGEGSAELAAQMYDEMAAAAKVSVPAAEPAEVASPAEVAKAVYKTLSSSAQYEGGRQPDGEAGGGGHDPEKRPAGRGRVCMGAQRGQLCILHHAGKPGMAESQQKGHQGRPCGAYPRPLRL